MMVERAASKTAATASPWWRPRWFELLPEAVLGVGLTAFLVDEPDAATSAFRSVRAVTIMAIFAFGWTALRILLARSGRWVAARTCFFGIAAAFVLAVVVLPAYDNDTVVEAFPTSHAPTDVTSPSTAPPVAPTTGMATAPDPPATTPRPTPTTPGPTPTTPGPAAEPVRLRTGSFRGVDHRASGTVAIYRQADGRHVVGLEDFDIQPGPDYDVYLVPGEGQEDRGGGTRLDDLRGNRGTQFYDIPANVDVESGPWTVLVWCQTFGVPVATATPSST